MNKIILILDLLLMDKEFYFIIHRPCLKIRIISKELKLLEKSEVKLNMLEHLRQNLEKLI